MAEIETYCSFMNLLLARKPSDGSPDGSPESGLSLRSGCPRNEETAYDHELPRHKCWSRPFPSGWCPAGGTKTPFKTPFKRHPKRRPRHRWGDQTASR